MDGNIIKLSFSQIDMFRSCARKWWMNYRMDIGEIVERETYVLVFGTVWHRVQECYHKGMKVTEIAKIIEAEEKIKEEDKKLMVDMLLNYINYNVSCDGDMYIPRSNGLLHKDTGFSFLFEEEFEEWSFIEQGVILTGVIDMVYAKDNRAWVIDHKTTDKPWGQEKMYLSLQAQLYHLVVSRLMPGHEVNFMWNIAEKHGRKGGKIQAGDRFGIQREPIYGMSVRDTHEELKYHIENVLRTTRYPGKSEGFHCAWCPYRDICIVGSNEVKAYNYIQSCVKGVKNDEL